MLFKGTLKRMKRQATEWGKNIRKSHIQQKTMYPESMKIFLNSTVKIDRYTDT